MKYRKLAAALVAVAFGGGLSLAAVAAPASAHTPVATATCEAITVNASYYETKPGTEDEYESVLVTPAVEYQPAVYGPRPVITPAVVEVNHTEYEFKHFLTGKTKWKSDPNWNAEWNWESVGWIKTGNTQVVIDVPAQDEVLGEAPLISAEVLAQPAVYEDVLVNEGTPGDETPNNVFVEINGATVANDPFGESYSNTFEFENPYIANDWVVTITAWNDPTGEKGWTETFYGTTTPCEIPVVDANPGATATAECGVATVNLTNEEAEYEDNKTASFTILVDGDVVDTPVVFGDESSELTFEFDEDSGDHDVVVKDSFSWETLAEVTVLTDCEEEPVIPTEPPATEQPKPTSAAAVPVANTTPTASSGLAETGFDMGGVYLFAALSAIVLGTALAGLSAVALKRRETTK